MTAEVWSVNGHDPQCAYIRGLHGSVHDPLDELPCDCDDFDDDDEYQVDDEEDW